MHKIQIIGPIDDKKIGNKI